MKLFDCLKCENSISYIIVTEKGLKILFDIFKLSSIEEKIYDRIRHVYMSINSN